MKKKPHPHLPVTSQPNFLQVLEIEKQLLVSKQGRLQFFIYRVIKKEGYFLEDYLVPKKPVATGKELKLTTST